MSPSHHSMRSWLAHYLWGWFGAVSPVPSSSPEGVWWRKPANRPLAHSTSSLALDSSFQTQFVALPRPAASLEHVTRLLPPWPQALEPGAHSGQHPRINSYPGPATSLLGPRLCLEVPAQPGPGSWIMRVPLALCSGHWKRVSCCRASGPDCDDHKLGQTHCSHQ